MVMSGEVNAALCQGIEYTNAKLEKGLLELFRFSPGNPEASQVLKDLHEPTVVIPSSLSSTRPCKK